MSNEERKTLDFDEIKLDQCIASMKIYGIEMPKIECDDNSSIVLFKFEIPNDVHKEMASIVIEDYVKMFIKIYNKANPDLTIHLVK